MLDEGVRIALPEARTVGYVEREAHTASLLLDRMEDEALEPAPVWCGPLEDFRAREWRGAVDCITAGFPCQPWSAAGKQAGFDDHRWIWPAIARILADSETPAIFLENVPGLVVGLGLNRVLGDLAWLMGMPWWWTSIGPISFARSEMEWWRSMQRSLLLYLLGVSDGEEGIRERNR